MRYETRRFDPSTPEKDARVAALKIRMVLQGEYANLRQFIYQLESAPEFVIIDDMTLTEGPGERNADAPSRSLHLLHRQTEWRLIAATRSRLIVLAVMLAGLAYRAWSPAARTSAATSNARGRRRERRERSPAFRRLTSASAR